MAMFEYSVTRDACLHCMEAKGRIDALSAPEIQKVFNDLILEGSRLLLIDLSGVHYISSAGLRVLIRTQKELKKAGGEIILAGIRQPVMEIFKVSGFADLFRFVPDRGAAEPLLGKGETHPVLLTRDMDHLSLAYRETNAPPGEIFVVGSQEKLDSASYEAPDVVTVSASRMAFGCGLAAMGESFEEYRDLFGEALVLQHHFFFYPAVKQPAVDFMLDAHRNPGAVYRFLHGFGFNGAYRYVVSFQPREGAVDMAALVRSFFTLSRADLIGVVLIAESKGLWGMHMRKPPVMGPDRVDGESIFSPRRFAEWFDFPVEPASVHHLVATVGIATREPGLLSPALQRLFSQNHPFHIHGGVLDKAPLGSDVATFEKEVTRILSELTVHRIQHLLGQSLFAGGMAGIVEFEA